MAHRTEFLTVPLGRFKAVAVGAQSLQDVEPAPIRQPQIEKNEIIGCRLKAHLSLVARECPVDGVALTVHMRLHRIAQHLIVFHQEHAHPMTSIQPTMWSLVVSWQAAAPPRKVE